LIVNQPRHHCGRGTAIVGRVTISDDVDIGIDVRKHSPDDLAFALPAFGSNNRTSLSGYLDRAIGAVVIIDIDLGIRKCSAEAGNRIADGDLLIVAWQNDGQPRPGSFLANQPCHMHPGKRSTGLIIFRIF
jgi:hypothetical protein